jgi:hypothetical protein
MLQETLNLGKRLSKMAAQICCYLRGDWLGSAGADMKIADEPAY